LEKLDALFRYVQKNVSYVRDNANMEMVHSPAWQITSYNNNGFYHGDCDDHVILLGSMLISVGYPVSLAVVRVGNTPGAMNHVYLETVLKGKWIAMDATKKDSPMGWKPQAARMQRIPV
jgi:transglutaminase-like putative cysteine protease